MMTLQTYLNNLNRLVSERPELLELPVVYSGDSEGNSYDTVSYEPSLGFFDLEDWDFIPVHNFEEERENYDNLEINCVCIN